MVPEHIGLLFPAEGDAGQTTLAVVLDIMKFLQKKNLLLLFPAPHANNLKYNVWPASAIIERELNVFVTVLPDTLKELPTLTGKVNDGL